ncbi:cupin domain-containing protein [Leptolyngbyaceae cyanobacterium CCMR0082]|uniref:Cupin domain-containing protein n=1 Tax=Adonisia turfae CCMR0082 TaxID=2304604 RepID=A0A6M0RZJ2_9CYAN|nr:cupin domain-containing protein [Adonisia turfae]EKU97819.1 cupin domain-containing protein [Leptolyngbya sp. PCC 7375]NEZ61624.1 cupin domain-containing protein [Adonisia turfae CCMR0082]
MKRVNLNELKDQGVSHNTAIRKKVMLQPGDIPHLTNFSQATFAPGQVAKAHAHSDMYEVFFVSAGSGTMAVNGMDQALLPGVCILVEPGDVHEVTNTGAEPLVLTYFGIT